MGNYDAMLTTVQQYGVTTPSKAPAVITVLATV